MIINDFTNIIKYKNTKLIRKLEKNNYNIKLSQLTDFDLTISSFCMKCPTLKLE